MFVEYHSLGTHVDLDMMWCGPAYWLWPLPAPEPFSLVVEWSEVGMPLTRTEMDGGLIVREGQSAIPFWPGQASRT